VRQAEPDSLMPYVQYGQRKVRIPEMRLEHVAAADKGSAGIRLSGGFPSLTADEKSTGQAVYTVSLLAHRPYLLLRGEIRYPASDRDHIIKADEPGLSRRLDIDWREVAPAEIQFSPEATPQDPPRILKRNYLGVETHYTLDYFRHSPENLNLDNVNNHITQSYVGIVSGEYGMAIATDTTVQANFAFAPLKMTYDPGRESFQIRANPFGTYHGRQYRPPTRGNGQGYEMTLYTGEQLASAAPTYNGVDREFSLLISFFKGKQMPPQLKEDLLGYAHPPVVVSLNAPAGNNAPPAASLGKPTSLSGKIGLSLSPTPGTRLQYPKIPLGLKVKVLWANVKELIDDVPAMLRRKKDHL
jgi:hypothetical protein